MPAGQRQDWEDLSELDPCWAILSEPEARYGQWDRAAFMDSGRREIDELLRDADRLGVARSRRDALDFGCGVGRLTHALSGHFERCVGLDISERMVEQARRLAGEGSNCHFAVHEEPDLGALEDASFDVVVSRFVLQHVIATAPKERYIAEFVRVLRPDGLLAFQLPSWIPPRHRIQPRPRLYGLLRAAGIPSAALYRKLHLHPIRMTFLPQAHVLSLLESCGARTLDVREQTAAGGVRSVEYLAAKAPARSERAS